MREILFRGKTFDNEWVYGYYVNQYKYPEIYCQDTSVGERRAIIPETVGQYTGVTDVNGKKIFEGDIVIVEDSEPLAVYELSGVFCVDYSTCDYDYDALGFLYNDCLRIEVIGNIFDNPELLEGDTEE